MNARVTTVQGSAERLDDAIRAFREQIVPILQGQAGFQGGYLLVDRGSGKARSVTLWESEAAMHESEPAVAQHRAQVVHQLDADASMIEHYEVAFTEGETSGAVARVTAVQGMVVDSNADVDAGLRYVRDRVLPAMRQAGGFVGMIYLVDRSGGKTLGVGFFDSEAALRGSDEAARQLREGADRAGLAGARTVEAYEVAAQV